MTYINRRGLITSAVAFGLLNNFSLAAEILQHSDDAPLSNERILKLLQERLDARQSLGMAIGVIDRAGRRVVTAGQLGKSDARPITAATVFGIASVTKPFVALLLADAVLRGEFAYEAPAARYLPAEVRLPGHNGHEITVLDLATHTSGLPHELPQELASRARAQSQLEARRLMYEFLSSCKLNADPGSTWSYSNLGYALLAHMLENRTGMSYASLMRARLLNVLGLQNTSPDLTDQMKAVRASPHLASLDPSPEWHKPWMGAVLQSTCTDLLKFLEACMGRVPTPLSPAFAAMLEVDRPAPALNARQALAWHVYPYEGRPLIGHSGGGGGFAATIMFDPNARTGVVLLSNAELLQQDVAQHVLREQLPMEPIQKEFSLAPAALEAFVGEYRDGSGAITSIKRQSDQLLLLMPAGHKAPLTPDSPNSFFVRGFAGLTASFELDAHGRATVLHWTLSGKTITAHRQ